MAWDRARIKQVAILSGCVLASLAAVVATGPGGGAAVLLAVSGLAGKVVEGLIPNVLDGMLGEDLAEQRADRQLNARGLQNADIHRLGGQAIALVLNQCAAEFIGDKAGTAYLTAARDAVKKQWDTLPLDARYDPITEPEADRFYIGAPAVVKATPTLNERLWQDLIGSLAYDAGHEAHVEALKFAAKRLSERYTAAMWEVAKRAWKKDDLAWPALQLRLLSEIRGDLQKAVDRDKGLAKSVADLDAHFTLLTKAAHDQAEGVVRRLGAKLDATQAAVLKSIDDLSGSLASALGTTFNSLSDLHDKLDIVATNTALLPDMQGTLQNVQDRLTPKVPLQPVPKPDERSDTYVFSGRRVEMVGRDAEMDALRQFMTDPRRVLWWLWKGPAGIGKSRFALELCIEALHGPHDEIGAWHAGFLDGRRDVPTDWTNVAFPRDTLLVVDYVSSKAPKVHNWLYQLCEKPPSPKGARLRFILLDREEYDIWTRQLLGDQRAREVIESACYQDTRSLKALSDDDLWAIMVEATTALKKPIDPLRRAEVLEAMQSCNPGKRPLFAAFAAAALVEGKPIHKWKPEDLAKYVLDHEEAEWTRRAEVRGVARADLFKHKALLALATLAHGVECGGNYDALVDDVTPSGAAPMLPAKGTFAGSWGLLDEMVSLTGTRCGDGIVPLQPDYVGEFFVLEHVAKRITQPAMRCAFLRGAIAADEVDTAATLLRMMQNFPQHEGTRVLLECVLPPGSGGAGVEGPLPPSPFSTKASWVLDTTLGTIAHESDQAARAERLYQRSLNAHPNEPVTLNNYANLLSNNPAQAARAAEMYERALALRPDDAATLYNYANLLSKNPAQAARAAEMYERALALRPDHAATLNNYANLLSNNPAQAARAAEMYERSLALRPDDADTLNNYAALLSKNPAQAEFAANLFAKARQRAPENPVVFLGFVTILAAAVDRDEGLSLIRATLESGTVPGGGAGALVLLFLVVGFAAPEEAGAGRAALKQICANPKARVPGWSFDVPLVYLRKDGHPDLAWLEKLAQVLIGKADPSVLDGWEKWSES